jgi:hypothetical protein
VCVRVCVCVCLCGTPCKAGTLSRWRGFCHSTGTQSTRRASGRPPPGCMPRSPAPPCSPGTAPSPSRPPPPPQPLSHTGTQARTLYRIHSTLAFGGSRVRFAVCVAGRSVWLARRATDGGVRAGECVHARCGQRAWPLFLLEGADVCDVGRCTGLCGNFPLIVTCVCACARTPRACPSALTRTHAQCVGVGERRPWRT